MKLPRVFKFSPKTILLQWEPVISEEVQQAIRLTEQFLLNNFKDQIFETTLTYNELAIYLKVNLPISVVEEKLDELSKNKIKVITESAAKALIIPVCYEAEFALDLAEVANYHKITEEEVVKLHSQTVYTVSFVGFLPGFPYLMGLSEKLYTPRKETPRTSVAQGSVGIGGKQTGVYPSNSPGGWQLIGRSPLEFFTTEKASPSLLKAGDNIQFQPISKAKFELISLEIASGVYQLKTEIL